MVYSTRRYVVCLSMCHFLLVFFSPFSIAITWLGEERANLSAFRTFVRFVLFWICRFPLSLGVWEGRSLVLGYTGPMCYNVVFYLQEDAQANLVLHWSLNVKCPFSIWKVMHRQV